MASPEHGTLRNLLEYGLVRGLGCFVRMLPLRTALAVGRATGSLLYRLSGRRKVALENLRLAYGDELSAAQLERTARNVFRNTAQSVVESIWLRRRLTPQRLERLIVFEGLEKLEQALSAGQGALVVTGHLGNWELAGQALSMRLGPTYSVARPLKNDYLDRYLNEFRQEHGQHIIDRSGALKELVKVLRDNRLVILLIDQHAHSGGIQVKFFGRDAWTTTAPAALALRLGCPVAVACCHRDEDGLRHHVVIDEVLRFTPTGDRQEDTRRATETLTQKIERFVRLYPEEWFWVHRRWKPGPLIHPKGARVERYA